MGKETVSVAVATLRVLEGWGVDTIYGLPSGTLSSFMDGLSEEQSKINFIQVKHEEVGAMAAVMQSKWGGSLAVCVGSGGPGATHLINGLYDAAMDNTPVIAILGSRPHNELNLDAFQELNQNPMYDHIAVFNRRAAYAEQVPKLMDEAARVAMAKRGVAVIEIPTDFGYEQIDVDSFYSSGPGFRKPKPYPLDEQDVSNAVELLKKAERPVIYAGMGVLGHGDLVEELSRKIKAPVITTGKSFETIHWDFEALLGSCYRVGWKPANEAILEADTVLFVGSNFPFAEADRTFRNIKHFIQVDNNPAMLGKRHAVDVSILGDAGVALQAFLDRMDEVPATPWWKANLANVKNWRAYMDMLEGKSKGDLQVYQVYRAINKVADENAIFSVDVGNSTQTSIRHLHMTPKNMWRTSPLFATMGIALPGGIAAKHTYPDRQVWNLQGDGAFSMVYPDVVTNVRYDLPVINIVFTNCQYGFIKDKYEDTNKTTFGTQFTDVDYAMAGRAQGAVGYTVDRIEDIDDVMRKAVEDNKAGKTVVVDCKITQDRPLPVEVLELDERLHGVEAVKAYKAKYEAEDLIPLREYLEQEGLTSQYIA